MRQRQIQVAIVLAWVGVVFGGLLLLTRPASAQLPSRPTGLSPSGGSPKGNQPAQGTATPTATPTCGGPAAYRILIAYSDIAGQPTTLRTALMAESGVSTVDLFDAST